MRIEPGTESSEIVRIGVAGIAESGFVGRPSAAGRRHREKRPQLAAVDAGRFMGSVRNRQHPAAANRSVRVIPLPDMALRGDNGRPVAPERWRGDEWTSVTSSVDRASRRNLER